MKIEKIQINKLKPAKYNPRQISTKQYNDLKKSIEKFSLVDPIIINKDLTVIGGHQQLKVCKELKHVEIDCVVLDLSKEEERELNIRLNKNTGTWDWDTLANNFDELNLQDWGFESTDFFNDDTVDYGVVDNDESLNEQLDALADGTRKSLLVDFHLDDYDRAVELMKSAREQDIYVGGIVMEAIEKAIAELGRS